MAVDWDAQAMVEAVMDVLAPWTAASLPGFPEMRMPIFLAPYDGQAVVPSDEQVRALAEQIVTAIRTATAPAAELVTRTEMAARRDVHISTMMLWIDRYRDFPAPARTDGPQPLYDWGAVKAYLDAAGLPRFRDPDAQAASAERDRRILDALTLFPDGLTTREIADMTGQDEDGDPTPLAVRVRIDDRLRRLEAAGKVTRGTRPSTRRGVLIWKPATTT